MNTVPLGDLIVPAKVRRAGNGDFPLLSMTMHDGLVDQSTKFKKRVASNDVSTYKVICRGQLVVGFPIDEGVLDFQELYAAGIVSPAYGVWDLRSPETISRAYLKKYLRSPAAMAYYKAKLRGSTARRRSLPTEDFLALPVPAPPLDEQRRIATILDHADAIRTTRRQVLTHLDTLTQSIFHHMFGAPSFEAVALIDAIKWSSGKFLPAKAQAGGEHPVYGGNGVNGYHNEFMFRQRRLVVGRVGAYCGAVHVTEPQSWVTDNALVATLLRDDLTLDYLLPALKQANLNQHAGVSGQPSISGGKIGHVQIQIPPVELQQTFAKRVERLTAQRGAVEKSLVADDELFASLQSRAFSGSL